MIINITGGVSTDEEIIACVNLGRTTAHDDPEERVSRGKAVI